MGRCELIYKTRIDAENAALCLYEQQLPNYLGGSFFITAKLSIENVERPLERWIANPEPQKVV